MFRKRLLFKRTWWNSLELLVVSLVLVQSQGTTSLIAKTLEGSYGTPTPDPGQPNGIRGRSAQSVEPIRLADEPVYIDRPPISASPEASIADADKLIDSGHLDDAADDRLPETTEPDRAEPQTEHFSEPSSAFDEPTYVADEPSYSQSTSPPSSQMARAVSRSQQELLAGYQNKIYGFVVNQDLKTSLEGSPIRTEAKEETIAALEQLDSNRKATLLKFLAESNLIDSQSPIISLVGADLSSADLNRVNLSNLDLRDADLRDANLNRANLSGTKLFRAALNRADLSFANLNKAELFRATLRETKLFFANLSNANLNGADLQGSDVSLANLSGTDLSNAELSQTDFSFANLSSAKLVGATLNSADLSFTNLKGATLKGADLSNANLRNADLTGADLSGASLSGADLTGANLKGANLFGVDLNQATLSNTTLSDGTVKK